MKTEWRLVCRPRVGDKKLQKKEWRALVGLLRPIRCPKCRTYTEQVKVNGINRGCVACESIFTRAQSRRALKGPRGYLPKLNAA